MSTIASGVTSSARGASPFVGRARERALLAEEIGRGTRLLTLTGPSGIGKTRLALHASRESAPVFDGGGGVRVCELSACRTAEELEAEVARVLGSPTARNQGLAEAIASRGPLLLVLDDAHDLEPAATARIAGWLDRCVELQIVATSIVPLGLAEEHRFELGPLDEEDAVALYLDRARRAWVNRPASDGEDRWIGTLVRQLDGIPLAIELAAARVRVLPPQALLSRMDERWELLRDESGSHRSLLGAISLTWEFLAPHEREALARLSAFEGGFTLEAAAALLDPEPSAVATIDALRGKALVRLDAVSPPRFSLLESVRAFGRRELAALDPASETVRLHAAYFAQEGERRAREVDGAGAPAAIAWLAAERPNLVAARDRSRAFDRRAAARIGLVLLSLRGEMGTPVLDGAQADEALGDARASSDPPLIVRALRARGEAWRRVSRLDEAISALDEAVALAAAQGMDAQEALVRVERSAVWIRQGSLAAARAEVSRAIELSSSRGDGWIEGQAWVVAGAEAMARGAGAEAEASYRRGRALLGASGDLRREAEALVWLASTWIEAGLFAEAIRAVQEAGESFRRIGSLTSEAATLINLGGAHLAAGNLDEAEAASAAALELNRRLGHRRNEAIALSNLGVVALERSRFTLARQLLQEACGILEIGGERRYQAPILPFLAFAAAIEGRAGESERHMEEARAFFVASGDEGNLRVIRVLSCAAAVLAPSGGDRATSAAEAGSLLREGSAGLAASCLFPALRLLQLAVAAPQPAAVVQEEAGVVAASDGSWFDAGGGRISLRRRNVLRRLLLALVRAREAKPGIGIGQPELFRQVWNGETALPDAAARRVYFAIWTLRGMGLSGVLLSRADGYLLDPSVPLRIEHFEGSSKIA
ncbi:MAG TPA: tetratricopeptide repeat protein [Vulgatibacter sp.]